MKSKLIEKFIKDHEGEEITKHEGNFSSLVWGVPCLLIYSPLMPKYFSMDFGSLALLLGKGRGMGFFNFDRYKESTKQALEKYLKDREGFSEFDDYVKIKEEIHKLYVESPPAALRELGDEGLERVTIDAFHLLRDLQMITLFSEALDEDIAREYFDKLKADFDFREFFDVASLIDFESFTYEMERALLNFDSKKAYDTQWIFGSYLCTPPIGENEELADKMMEELGGRDKIEGEHEKLEGVIIENKRRVSKFREKLPGELVDFFDFVKMVMNVRDVRKRAIYETITIFSNSVREIFSRLGLDKENIVYAIHEDFVSGRYKSSGYADELKKRSTGFIIYFGKRGPEIDYVDFDWAKKTILTAMFGSGEEIMEIKGNVANKGYARGKVKVVLSKKDFEKFEEGEILVTSMTRPEFVPLMKKAAAVITDEGGLTCHAAIVSRELDKPCIIGTKFASNVLKDGDLVEVDANEGIVKIISKAGV